ncbi:MAG: ABC transporter permease [Anaerolineales bacterium]|jgi:putative ABC transport system permease protein|uniref:ABC transporter permease n=1 Tax=Candidatus Villigracilis affinis TaxID=3140682 RepID=UPI001DDD4FF3|nr:ABC transporter permease [Anaerolineales bacterium]MBK9603234.1 ABC transporter permease [Anaerolineales bacterium]MBL0346392.1 ABC transporter permease [Anaerolineales bacterium]
MNFTQALLEAIESLNGNKMRSGLTVLGIVIGVAAVIAMLAVGNGAQASITGSISSIGTNLLFVFRGSADGPPGGPGSGGSGNNDRPLTLSDAEAIADPLAAPSVDLVAPAIQGNGTITFSGENTTTTISGVTPGYAPVRNLELAEGEFINEEHILGRMSVVVLGPETAIAIFGHSDGIVGETIRIEGQPFRIIGVLVAKGGGAFGSEDNSAYIPFTTAQARLIKRSSLDEIDVLFVQATTAESVPQAADEISNILRQRHRTPIGDDDFTVFTQQDFLQTFETITGVLTIFLGGIAGISLLVGGIGIMNIMLVSVTERTREIGLRKALGARKKDILLQFLTESSLLSLIGGIIGVMFGWLIAFTVGQVATATGNNFVPIVGTDAILLSTSFSAVIGLFFGIYPASRAANLEPVEALRYE